MCALWAVSPQQNGHNLLPYFTAMLGEPREPPGTGRLSRKHGLGTDAHLRGTGWLPCLLNALSSLPGVVLAVPPGKEKFKGGLSASGLLSTAGLPSERPPHLPSPLWASPWLGK